MIKRIIFFILFTLFTSSSIYSSRVSGSCSVNKGYFYCLEYQNGFTRRSAKQNCRFAGGRFSYRKCASLNRQGACLIYNKKFRRTHMIKYYKKTWRQMSYKSQINACKMWEEGGFNKVNWIKGDPDNPNVKPYHPENQYPKMKIKKFKRGSKILIHKQYENHVYLYPATILTHRTSQKGYSKIRYYDGKKKLVLNYVIVKKMDWEYKTKVYYQKRKKRLKATIKSMIGYLWKIKLSSGKIKKVHPKYLYDTRQWISSINPFYLKKKTKKDYRNKKYKNSRNYDKELNNMKKDLKELEAQLK